MQVNNTAMNNMWMNILKRKRKRKPDGGTWVCARVDVLHAPLLMVCVGRNKAEISHHCLRGRSSGSDSMWWIFQLLFLKSFFFFFFYRYTSAYDSNWLYVEHVTAWKTSLITLSHRNTTNHSIMEPFSHYLEIFIPDPIERKMGGWKYFILIPSNQFKKHYTINNQLIMYNDININKIRR